ncbi:zinc ribbon domain-containing protein [Brevibacterium sp. XM4083]|uniref:FmdB family zinc ribbon protein n=1 Tax=Brevibacterium sp. XM4083 TaxID=2583238 RepID=UPI0011292D00
MLVRSDSRPSTSEVRGDAVPTYVYRCDACGDTEQTFPMLEKPSTIACPRCAGRARSVVSSPHLGAGNTPAHRLLDATAATADAPPVVTRLPGSPRAPRRVSRDPRHQRLPRA